MAAAGERWLLYGATGYTGDLIAREAVRGGLRPVLGGRSREKVEALARELGTDFVAFSLDNPDAARAALRGNSVVLNCAGPFSATAAAMMAACLDERVHYLDITGEVDVFDHAQRRHEDARSAGVLLCPGVGFDVVPTDCIAATLAREMPDATHLALGFDSKSRLSRGTSKTMIEGLAQGSRVRIDGQLRSEPMGARVREIDFGAGPKTAMSIAWGDVSTAFWTTRIPNVEVYIPASPRAIKSIQRMHRWRWLLGLSPVQALMKKRVDKAPPGPDATERERSPVMVWGEVRNARGVLRTARLQTANGYSVTVEAALGILGDVLRNPGRRGYFTPSQLVGADFVTRLRGSTSIQLS
jgi:short subunit dehydrogenase-like uncharacterized protein